MAILNADKAIMQTATDIPARRFGIGGETLNRQTTLSCYRASDHPLSGVLCRAEMGSYKERANEEALQGHRRARQSETPKAPQC